MRNDSVNLDLIRATAVLCVFFAHFCIQFTEIGGQVPFLFGQLGVVIFFVHTALVLMMSLERSAERLQGTALTVDFYIRRFFRIYPLSVLCVVAAFVGLVPTRAEPWPWSTFWSNLALTMNLTYSDDMWPVLWTLPLEVQMYLVLPALFLFLRGRALGWAFAVWGAMLVVGVIQPHISGRLSLGRFAPCFMAGVIAWRLSRTVRPRWSAVWWPVAFFASWAVWLVAERTTADYYRWAFCLVLGCLIPWFHEIRWAPIVVAARTVAKYSYGIYLSHAVIMSFAFKFEGPARWLVLVSLAVLVPVAMYHMVEEPMIRMGRRVASWLRAQPQRFGDE
jgi:peptidoglycan/LPS O-acetylase OafA/YrhL